MSDMVREEASVRIDSLTTVQQKSVSDIKKFMAAPALRLLELSRRF